MHQVIFSTYRCRGHPREEHSSLFLLGEPSRSFHNDSPAACEEAVSALLPGDCKPTHSALFET